MGIDELYREAASMSRWQKHRFFVLIVGVIAVSMLLVGVALSLYNSSGTAQIDLSRPGYQDVRKQAAQGVAVQGYPSTGALDKKALDQFDAMYRDQAAKATSTASFDEAALSEGSLQLLGTDHPGAPAPTPAQ